MRGVYSPIEADGAQSVNVRFAGKSGNSTTVAGMHLCSKHFGCIPAASISASLRFSDFYWAFGGHHTVVTRFGGAIRDGEAFGVQSTAEQLAHRRSPARHVPAKTPIIDGSKLVFSQHDLQAFATWVSHDGLLPDHVSIAQATTHTQFQLR
jgi:hypothetical protein